MVLIFCNSALNFDSMSIYFNLVFKAALRTAASEIFEISDFPELRDDLLCADLILDALDLLQTSDFLFRECIQKYLA